MSDRRSRRALALLRDALARAPGERRGWLAEAAGDDASLRAEVETLLAADDDAEGFLEGVVGGELRRIAADDRWIGKRIGPYRVLRRLGDGGMSTVYLAARADDELVLQVAIKVIKRGMDSEDVERRFLQERQILASLDHPNIAKLLDGGTTESGQPFFILEHIEGLPIDRYCRTEALGLAARIRLFLTVCAAVAHAHRRLVVHRDLKPSNILVTPSGEPKLLDFGIAKLLSGPLGGAPTVGARRPLTPEYASPEQIRGEPTTTASDVYSLGVLLYRLLAEQPPYRLDDASPAEVERQVTRGAIPAPSVAVTRAARPGDPADARRARRLRGDLDTITLKALRQQPGERYPSVDRLASDLQRFLDGRPVGARRPTLAYRFGKLVRRHKPAAVAGLLATLAVLGGVVATVWQARAAVVERSRAEAERDRAEQIALFLSDLFEVVDPSSGRGDTVTARELLDSGTARIEWQLADQPLLQAELLDTIGPIYRKLGLFEDAAAVLERALDMRRTALGPAHASIAQSLDHLGAVRVQQGDYDAAEPLLDAALAMRRQVLGDHHPRVAESLNNLGELGHLRGELDDAEARFTAALAKLPREGGDPVLLGAVLNNLASVRGSRGDLQGGERLLEEALAVFRRGPGRRSPEAASTLNNLALMRFRRGDLAAAEPLLVTALDLRRELLGDDHPEVAQSLNNLARVRYELGDAAGAEPLYREAVARKRALLGDHHPSLAFSLHGQALVLADQDRREPAEASLREALAIRRAKLAAHHPALAETLLVLGELLLDDRRLDEAEPLLAEAVRIRRAVLPADDWRLAEAENALGAVYALLGRPERGSLLLDRSLSVLVRELGDDHRATRKARRRQQG